MLRNWKTKRRALEAAGTAALVLLLALAIAAGVNLALPGPAVALGTVAPLDPWPATPQMTATTGDMNGTFTASDGVNRLVVVLVCSYDSGGSNSQTFTATYGGKALAEAFLQRGGGYQAWLGYLREADIAGRSGDAVTVAIAGTHSNAVAYVASYRGVDQASPITGAGGRSVNLTILDLLPTSGIGGPLIITAGGYGIYGWSCTGNRTRSSDSQGYAASSNVGNPASFSYGVASKAHSAAGTTDPQVTWSGLPIKAAAAFITLRPDTAYPVPDVTGISPASRTVGDAPFTLSVSGSNFVNGLSTVRLDGADRATTFVSSTQLTAVIPTSDLAATGDRSITVFTPPPGGGTSATLTLKVRLTPAITWANPGAIAYGTALSYAQLNATASVPGTFVYSPGPGALLPAGNHQTLHVDFTPSDTLIYNTAAADVSVDVAPRAITVTANDLSKAYRSAASFTGTEFTAVGLLDGDSISAVTLSSAGAAADATVDGSPYVIVPGGATGTGLQNYQIAYVNGALTVTRAAATLALTSPVVESAPGRPLTVTVEVTGIGATGTVTLMDGSTVLGSSPLAGGAATFEVSKLGAGTHSITAVYGGDANYAGGTSPALDIRISAAAPADRSRALLAGLLAAGLLLALILLLLALRRRRKKEPAGAAISPAPEGATAGLASLAAVEETGTYGIQLERELETAIKRVQKSMEAGIQAVCLTVENKDPYVAAHQQRVSQLACTIAKEMGLTDWQVDGIRVAALLHDIGKITVPTEILCKPGKLSELEMAMIKDHPRVAYDILKGIDFDWPIARIVVQHHERMDGSGYPYGMKGEDILLEARILAVADVVEAMSSSRPYRPALGVDKALAELARGNSTIYDPDVVRACDRVINERGFKIELSAAAA